MNHAMVKLAPLAGFLAAVGYCVWPYIAPPQAPPAPEPKLPKIEVGWLKPDFGPSPGRDPFLSPAAAAQVAGGPAGDKAKDPASEKAEEPPADPMPEFQLGATLIAGDRRAAIIDGRVYRLGERIESENGDWTVGWVERERVLLTQPERRHPVSVQLTERSTGAAGGPGRPGQPAPGTNAPAAPELDFGEMDPRAALIAAGVPLPGPSMLEELSAQSGGSLSGAYRSLLGLLASPPRPATPAAEGTGAGPAAKTEAN